MKAVFGLGNPGPEYISTRHNLGFRVVEEVAERLGARFSRRKFNSFVAESWSADDEKLFLAKPYTFMNRSGEAVRSVGAFYQLNGPDILVICDDFNLPLGQLRLRRGGSDGGHNGLRSIIDALGHQEFVRLRIGIGSCEMDRRTDFVLSDFRAGEMHVVADAVLRAADAAECWISEGVAEAMNRFNRGELPRCSEPENQDSNQKGV